MIQWPNSWIIAKQNHRWYFKTASLHTRRGDGALISYGSFMQTKHLCVLIHIWTKCEVGVPLNRFKPSSKIFLLTVPRRYFFCGSFMLFLSCVCCAFLRVCLLLPCGHLLGKGWPLGSRLWCLIVSVLLSHWYPESGMVLDCIDSWSLPSFLLYISHRCYYYSFESMTPHLILCHIPVQF